MIDQLLAVARVENRGLSFAPQPVKFSKVCDAVALSHSRVISSHSPDCHPGETDPIVMTDLQTLRNLRLVPGGQRLHPRRAQCQDPLQHQRGLRAPFRRRDRPRGGGVHLGQ